MMDGIPVGCPWGHVSPTYDITLPDLVSQCVHFMGLVEQRAGGTAHSTWRRKRIIWDCFFFLALKCDCKHPSCLPGGCSHMGSHSEYFFKVFMGLIPLAPGQWLPKEGGIREEHTAFHVSKCCFCFFFLQKRKWNKI